MNQAQENLPPPLGLIDKSRVFAGVVVAVLLMRVLGWMVAEPVDPALAVTFTSSGHNVLAIGPALLVLTVVAGILGTVIAGQRLPEAGLFVAGIGLVAMGLRGGSMLDVLAASGAVTEPARQQVMTAMLIDVVLWTVIMAATWFAVSWAWRWIWYERRRDDPSQPRPVQPTAMQRVGWPALVITAVVGLFVVWITAGRTPVAPIARNQTIAAVAGAMYLGAMVARYFTGIDDSRWYLLAVPLVAVVGFVIGYLSSDMSWAEGTEYQYYALLATTPPHDLVRPLPLDYLAAGVPAVLLGFWSGEKVEQVVVEETG